MASRICGFLLRLIGWKIVLTPPPSPKAVIIGYPHTSNWDFPLGVLTKWGTGLQPRWWGKDSLFRIPLLKHWFRWLGGIPLDRRSARGVVGEMVAVFEAAKASDELLWLGLSPEGTRSHTPGWRSGFYQVALGARVPVALIRLDYGQREVRITDFIHLSGDMAADYARMAEAYHGVRGQRPDQASPIAPLPKRPTPDTV